jgi:anti-sigma regulatory factor (Ser/Thr protein kinase)
LKKKTRGHSTLKELSLHILDIAENSVNAGAEKIEISVIENLKKDKLSISIIDNGKGMDAEMVRRVTDPFITTRTTRKVGLGIPFLKEAAEACQGGLKIESKPGAGTKIDVEFQRSHIDRMPLGDLTTTFLNLLIGYPKVNWVFKYQVDEHTFQFDDRQVKKTLQEVPLSDPLVIAYLKQVISSGIKEVAQNV